MSRINTNIQALVATRLFNRNTGDLNRSLTRLSTGLRINSGRDDPAGLIASETLRSQKVALTAATENARRADTIMAIAEGGLQEVNALLLDLEDLVDRTANEAGLTSAEVAANQLQIDSILQSINRLANTTAFGDKHLLDGTLDFSTSATAASSFSTNVASIQVNGARIADNSFRNVVIEVVTGSDFAFVSAYGDESAGTTIATGALSAAVTIQVAGNFGVETFSFASGATQSDMVTAINGSSGLTGVSAILSNNTGGINAVIFSSTTFGSKGFVSVDVISNSGGNVGLNLGSGATKVRDTGVDGSVVINGQAAKVDGLDVSVRTGALDVELVLAQTFGTTDNGSTEVAITGGGAKFAISPDVGIVGQATVGVKAVAIGSLGTAATGFLASLGMGETNDLSSGNFADAQRIVRAAISQISTLRGRIGAFQRNTIDSAINSMQVAFENTAAAESAIRDADFAVEVSSLTRAQILVSSSISTLQLANAGPQNVLSLLG
ncbi:MAG: flagellin [Phycisphaerae bacterium]